MNKTNYNQTLDELFTLQKFSIKMGLDHITHLCQFLGNPQRTFPSIHIAGTNGKGSTSIMIQEILAAHGLQSGLYTSPHLTDFRERIRINKQLIEADFITDLWGKVKSEVYGSQATFFDTTTAMAFEYFHEKKVDIAVIETGLGGRLDSTNIIQPVAVVITPIDIDHIPQLGSELEGIAAEKAAIIKEGSTLFYAEQFPQVEKVLLEYSERIQARYHLPEVIAYHIYSCSPQGTIFDFTDKLRQENFSGLRLNLLGEFQVRNALLAYLCARWYLDERNLKFSADFLSQVYDHIYWPGRLDRISQQPLIYFDVSHNFAGFKTTCDFIRANYTSDSALLLLGLLADKEYERIVQLVVNYFERIVVTEPVNDRKLPAEILSRLFEQKGKRVMLIRDPDQAFDFCLDHMSTREVLFVMGSHFLTGELYKRLNEKSLTYRK